MRRNMKLKHFAAVLFSSMLALSGQELDLSFLKGLEAKAKESTDINLGPEQIKLMMGFSGEGSKELQGLGKSIERVQVKTFEFDAAGAYNIADMEKLRANLKTGDYVPFISVKEKNGFTEIAMRKGPKGMNGFVILVAEPRELTVVNIVGEIDLASLGKLAGKFGIPNLAVGGGSKPANKGPNKDEEN
jgi:hypothetical protein